MSIEKKINLAILDDHQIVVDGLHLLIDGTENIIIKCKSTDGFFILNEIQKNEIDVLITDIMMPKIDGFEIAIRAKKIRPQIKIIILSMNGEGSYIHKLLEQNCIDGYLLKTADKYTLIEAIKAVYNNESYFTDEIVNEINSFKKLKNKINEIHLTPRELEIIKYISNGYTNKQMANELFLSERTIETHRKNIFRKTNLHTVPALIAFAQKQKLI
jgi:two-component system nitrate/nitrite response regulator NarL